MVFSAVSPAMNQVSNTLQQAARWSLAKWLRISRSLVVSAKAPAVLMRITTPLSSAAATQGARAAMAVSVSVQAVATAT